jgi:signal transduction histidine kinase
MPTWRAGKPGRFDLLDLALVAAIIGGTIGTFALLAFPDVHGHVNAAALDLVLDTIALVVTTAVAALTWGRYQEQHESIALAVAAAFLALAIADASAVVVAVVGTVGSIASDGRIGEAQLVVWTCARLLAGGLLVAGGVESLRGGQPRHPRLLVLGTATVMLVVLGLVVAFGDTETSLVAYPVTDPGRRGEVDIALTTAGAIAQLVGAGLFLVAAYIFRRLWRRDRVVGDAYLALGLVIAALAEIQHVLFPSRHPEQVGTGDLLLLAFYVVLLFGIQAEARAVMVALRSANGSLERLRDVEVERAALEERSRLSRELHDGLTQDLWLAKLQLSKAATAPGLDPETERLFQIAMSAVDDGLADARQAVAALRGGTTQPQAPLCTVLERIVDEFGDRYGIQAELECESVPAGMHHRTSAEVVRIVEEALSNAGRHADPTLVRVEARVASDVLDVTVRDNGRGFDIDSVPPGRFGLAGMRERAELIGGRLTIDSRPLDGTLLSLRVPLGSAGSMEVGA